MKFQVGIIMGSRSDWETMRHASETLDELQIAHEVRVVSAHRTPDLLFEYAETALDRGLKAIIAGDVLNLVGYRLRPYERKAGATDTALTECRGILSDALRDRTSLLRALRRCRGVLATVEVDRLQHAGHTRADVDLLRTSGLADLLDEHRHVPLEDLRHLDFGRRRGGGRRRGLATAGQDGQQRETEGVRKSVRVGHGHFIYRVKPGTEAGPRVPAA